MAVSDDLEPSDEALVVIVATGQDGEVVGYPDEERDDEVAVFLDGDPEIPGLLEGFLEVYGPSARVIPLAELEKLTEGAE